MLKPQRHLLLWRVETPTPNNESMRVVLQMGIAPD